MESTRWQKIQLLFHESADLAPSEQLTFLKEKCSDDETLLCEVRALLQEDARSDGILGGGVAETAYGLFGKPSPLWFSPREFGPYHIGKLLGEGGMGVVYLAEREDLGNPVAIKILRDAWLSPARRERFASEQRTLAQLNHPSIARLYDADTLADGTPWFAMEYVDGVPFTGYCRSKHYSIEERLQLFRLVCEAVQYAHGRAVIHRDLKPSNILVKEDGSVRLLDFGISKQLKGSDGIIDQTRTAVRLLTPSYAAPEQIRGEPVGTRGDVYSLGIILYELLAGRLPFNLSNLPAGQAEKMILEQEPEKPSAAAKEMGGGRYIAGISKASWADLDVLCLAAIRKDPERRYGSVEALIRDIDHYLKAEPLEARPDTLRYRGGKFIRRNRRAVFVSAAVFTAVVALVIFFTVSLASARNAALAQVARTQRIQKFMLSMFEGGDEDTAPANDVRLVTMLDRGVREARTLDKEPEVQADLYQTLGGIYQDLGNLAQADSLLRSALEKRESLFGRNDPESAKSRVALGVLRAKQGKLKEAEQLVRGGLEIDIHRLPPGDPATANAMAALGYVLEHRGSYGDAIRVLEEAVRLESGPRGENSELPATLTVLAVSQFYAGNYEVSDALNRRVLALYRQHYGNYYPLIADISINLGAIQLNLGHYAEAERFYRQAVDINQRWYGTEHPETAASLTMTGEVLIKEKRYDEAERLLSQALAVQERIYGPVHFRVAAALNQLGLVALQRRNLDEAEARFRRTTEIYQAIYGDQHYTVAVALRNMAGVYVERKEYGRAEQLYRGVVKRFTTALSGEHLLTGIARLKLGRALFKEQRYVEAEHEMLAGYQILVKQVSAPPDELRIARSDLASIYDELNRPDKAQQFRAQLADVTAAHNARRK
jgi:serine/threonine protein kinase/tetratricopeptide (TPR) repeat protein